MRRCAAVVCALVVAVVISPRASARHVSASWKGAETLTPVALAPNVARCGPPPTLEARFAGTGIDTAGGAFAVTASACLDLEHLQASDLEATDVYGKSRDSIVIAPDDFVLVLDPATCVATNAKPVPFHVAGGTGRYDDAAGGGTFHFALNHPACSGVVQPAHIWFEGVLRTRG